MQFTAAKVQYVSGYSLQIMYKEYGIKIVSGNQFYL